MSRRFNGKFIFSFINCWIVWNEWEMWTEKVLENESEFWNKTTKFNALFRTKPWFFINNCSLSSFFEAPENGLLNFLLKNSQFRVKDTNFSAQTPKKKNSVLSNATENDLYEDSHVIFLCINFSISFLHIFSFSSFA